MNMDTIKYGDQEPDRGTQWRTRQGVGIAYIQNGWSHAGSLKNVPWSEIHNLHFPMERVI